MDEVPISFGRWLRIRMEEFNPRGMGMRYTRTGFVWSIRHGFSYMGEPSDDSRQKLFWEWIQGFPIAGMYAKSSVFADRCLHMLSEPKPPTTTAAKPTSEIDKIIKVLEEKYGIRDVQLLEQSGLVPPNTQNEIGMQYSVEKVLFIAGCFVMIAMQHKLDVTHFHGISETLTNELHSMNTVLTNGAVLAGGRREYEAVSLHHQHLLSEILKEIIVQDEYNWSHYRAENKKIEHELELMVEKKKKYWVDVTYQKFYEWVFDAYVSEIESNGFGNASQFESMTRYLELDNGLKCPVSKPNFVGKLLQFDLFYHDKPYTFWEHVIYRSSQDGSFRAKGFGFEIHRRAGKAITKLREFVSNYTTKCESTETANAAAAVPSTTLLQDDGDLRSRTYWFSVVAKEMETELA